MLCKTFLFCLVVISAFNLGACLQCYVCSGSSSSDCAMGKTSSMVLYDCKTHHLPVFPFGLHSSFGGIENDIDEFVKRPACVSATKLDYHAKLVMRFCTFSKSDSDPCTFLTKHRHYGNCTSCTTDKCNSHQEVEIESTDYKW